VQTRDEWALSVYEFELDNAWLHVRGQGLDCGGEKPELLVTVVDNPQGWKDARRIVGWLEQGEVKDVSKRARPIHIGPPSGPDTLVIV
jgi:hypothetical protein